MNPWLFIPAGDYDGHMGPDGADQQAPLAAIFDEVYASAWPSSVALLGCATGNGLPAIDPALTPRIVGIDLNPEYLEVARQRHADLGGALDLRCADLLTCQLEAGAFALVHAALVFEHVDPAPLAARIAGWLAPNGICSVVLQREGGARSASPVAPSRFPSLQALAGSMRLVAPDDLRRLFATHGLAELRSWEVPLRGDKAFYVGLYGQSSKQALSFGE
jgi:hypothetical protein